MGWKIEVLIVFIKYRNKDIGGAERKFLDPYLGKWVYLIPRGRCLAPVASTQRLRRCRPLYILLSVQCKT